MIIVEDGEPVMVISPFESVGQRKFELEKDLDKNREKTDNETKDSKEINQNMELITKEELPVEELRVEDLPF